MGTPDFAIPSLEAIISSGLNLIAVVTQPDRPRGRGKKLASSPVKDWALDHNIKVLQPVRARDEEFIEKIRKLKPDLIITAAYGHIITRSLLDIPKLGCINVHASLLPKYRGASPIQEALLMGETETGITIMYMDEGIDTGNIILQEKISIHPDDNSQDLHDKLADLGGLALGKSLEIFKSGKPKGREQNHDEASKCSKISKENCKIDWNNDLDKIINHIRAYTPWPGAYTMLGDMRLKVLKANPIKSDKEYKGNPGEIIYADVEKGLVVSAKDGLIRLSQIQAPGKRVMDDVDFLRGNIIEIGQILE